jgi:hypothetical protein
MDIPIRLYRLLNILSIDVVAGAIVCALFFGALLDVQILPYGIVSLGLTVWIIYTADHLRDAVTITHPASSERHRFHQKHFRILLMMLCIAIFIDAVIIFFMRKPLLQWGIILAGIVVVYLVVQRYLKVLKEVFVALLYTAGVLLPSVSLTSVEYTAAHIIFFTQFSFMALLNLLIFSWFDNEADRRDAQHSFVTITGRRTTEYSIWTLGIINFLLSVFLWRKEFAGGPVFIFFVMNFFLVMIFIFSRPMRQNDAYRILGDAVFLIPGIFLLWDLL